ncbi:MAG: transposase [Elusimicrobiota bacterium]|nr:transposase [Elusimicrobiota bacterium]
MLVTRSFEPIPQALTEQQRQGGFIRYYNRSDKIYGSYIGPHHSNTNKTKRIEEYLGLVIDKEENIFYNTKWGFIKFSIQDGYTSLNDIYHINLPGSQNYCSLRYGNIWLLHDLYQTLNFETVLKNLTSFESDTLHALIAYKLTTGDNTFLHVQNWFQRSYARILYPNATVSSASISTYLKKLGESSIREKFFDLYHEYLKEDKSSDFLICNSILIDSTGAQNDINIPLTRISNHNGIVNNEFRVIYVVDHERNLPIYMNQVPGNIVDVSTLKYIVNLLIMRQIKVKCCVLDAGYYSDLNLEFLDSLPMNYLIRMCNHRKDFKWLIENESHDLHHNHKYRILYRKRYLHCKKIVITKTQPIHYAYIILDFDKEQKDRNFIYSKNDNDETIEKESNYMGKFILYSNFDIPEKDVLNFYYTREHIEQVFDISKNNASMLPFRTHGIEGTMGHLLLSFIATIVSLELNNKLKNTKYCAFSALKIMNDLSVYVNKDYSTVDPLMPAEKELAIILDLNLDSPVKVDLTKEYTNSYLNSLKVKSKKGRPLGRKNRDLTITTNNQIIDINKTKTDSSYVTSNTSNKSKRGRPKGSKNKVKIYDDNNSTIIQNIEKRRPGRPKGSKNKVKIDFSKH